MKRIIATLLAITLVATPAAAFWGTPPQPSSDKVMRQKAEAQAKQIDQMVGFPSIINGFEKRMVRMLYEKRDDPNYSTFTYLVNMSGKFIFLCNSVGFGINASIQFSNPEKPFDTGGVDRSATMMPQAEPNGLFMPEGLAATYVMCVDEEAEELKPVYVEPEIIVSPFKLH